MKKNVSINSFTKEELHKYVFDLGEKKYRAKQLWKWLYVNGAKSFNGNLPPTVIIIDTAGLK